MTLALLSLEGLSVSAVIQLCSTLVFPLLAYIWWQMKGSEARLWARVDELRASNTVKDTEIAVLRHRVDAIEEYKRSSVTLLDIEKANNKLKEEIEKKIDKSKQEYIEIVTRLFVKNNKGDA